MCCLGKQGQTGSHQHQLEPKKNGLKSMSVLMASDLGVGVLQKNQHLPSHSETYTSGLGDTEASEGIRGL